MIVISRRRYIWWLLVCVVDGNMDKRDETKSVGRCYDLVLINNHNDLGASIDAICLYFVRDDKRLCNSRIVPK